MNDLLREHASAHAVPGAALGVLRDGVKTFALHGIANTRTGAPVTAESRFGVGSLTKSMVATVVARLAQGGPDVARGSGRGARAGITRRDLG